MATRRGFLAGMASLTLPGLGWADVGSPAWLAAAKSGEDFVLHGLGPDGASLFSIPLPARGHAAAAHPSRPVAVAFARRPGTFALVLDCFTGAELHRLTPPEGRQFNGHGAWSRDGAVLMTSEVVAETSAGRIGLWEAETYARIGEWDSGGIGPHDIKLLADGSLVVANGGIATDPGDRTMLNIDTMRPNLARLSMQGELLEMAELEADLHQNSIRHLALVGGGVGFAMQWQGDLADPVPLLGRWTPGSAPQLFDADPAGILVMKGYAGSIAANGDQIAISSPRGGAVLVYGTDGTPLATHRRADVCGLAPLDGGFAASDGAGGLWQISGGRIAELPQRHSGIAWDNHMVTIG
ncbi:DUF1513 domain-containing protein [Xinfangfangia sp. D13-10-4-6]|uniref:DUF1513 domain-containing protein n=1 Tax=Pseudogemmobacter hezensis TaxID=2737662 RepID=UPI001551EE4C|nr:DUF1513 domain-containing protein [Pseudogemmobacter hezensis]NPD17123.1 DUF1513 domain-containing protein [Pseudogemmobacter hezensis]